MRRFASLTLICTVLAVTAGAAWADVHEEELFERTVAVDSNGRVSVDNTNGHILVEAWGGSEVRITATKKARARSRGDALELLDEIEIDISESGGNVTIDTILPRGKWLRGTSASVEYELKVPASVALRLKSTNGKVEAEGVAGDVELKTTNGSIYAEDLGGRLDVNTTNGRVEARGVAGPIDAKTTNGSVDLELTGSRLDEDMAISTTNGSVDLTLPSDLAARIDARAGNGRVRSDLPLSGIYSKRNEIEGDLNGGGPTIRIRTSNGSIRLREP